MLNKPLIRVPVFFGLLAGLVVFCYFLLLYGLGYLPLGSKKEISVGFNVILMGVAVWYYRRTSGEGYVHLWEGLSICYLSNFVAALISGSLIWLFLTYIDPTVLVKYIEENLKIAALTKAEVIKQMDEPTYQQLVRSLKTTTPAAVFGDEIIKKLFLGAIPALLISLYFRRQKPYNP